MFGKRLKYLILLLSALLFYVASGQWIAWLLLLAVVGAPWLSLALSLPAMLQFSVSPAGMDGVTLGGKAELWLLGSCPLPMPPFRGNLRWTHSFTAQSQRYKPEKGLDTVHCGSYRVQVESARVCDYLGLFSLPVRKTGEKNLYIRPEPVEAALPALPDPDKALRWQPKPGGGFSENHELRPYRPGDSLNQIHWKLSAKTGGLILREPQQAVRGRLLLTMTLRGTPEELDRKLGRLLWLGRKLLEQGREFDLEALTGQGLMHFGIGDGKQLSAALDQLLASPLTAESIRDRSFEADWQLHIGGKRDEA